MIDKINIRVYAIAIQNKQVLALFEGYAGDQLLKFPGGGLELGESLLECLHREFMEELGLKIRITDHFYTQEEFLVSKFRENEQLLTIYYLVEIQNFAELEIKDDSIEKIEWISLEQAHNPFTLPIDKVVFEKLQKQFLY